MKYRICLIGAGSIGALKPEGFDKKDDPENILTHAHAIYHLKDRFNFAGIVEPDSIIRERSCNKWEVNGYSSVEDFINYSIGADVYVIASSTPSHYKIIKEIIHQRPKLIIAEKPFCNSLEEAIEIDQLSKSFNVPIAINYSRRWNPSFTSVLDDIKNGTYGEIQMARLVYQRGLIREASHAMDLFNYTFGHFMDGKILYSNMLSNSFYDYHSSDLTHPAFLSFDKCRNVFICPTNGRNYACFDLDIWTSEGRILFTKYGAEIIFYKASADKVYGNYFSMHDSSKYISSMYSIDLQKNLLYLYEGCLSFLDSGKDSYLSVTIDDAISVHKIYHDLYFIH